MDKLSFSDRHPLASLKCQHHDTFSIGRYCQFSDGIWGQNRDHVGPSSKFLFVKEVSCARDYWVTRHGNSAEVAQWSDGRQLLFCATASPHRDISVTPGLLHPGGLVGGQADPRHGETLHPEGGRGEQCGLCRTNSSLLCSHKFTNKGISQDIVRRRFEKPLALFYLGNGFFLQVQR